MADRLQAGDTARVVDVSGLAEKMPANYERVRQGIKPDAKAVPFAQGDKVKVRKVTVTGQILTDRHGGLFRPHRFEKV